MHMRTEQVVHVCYVLFCCVSVRKRAGERAEPGSQEQGAGGVEGGGGGGRGASQRAHTQSILQQQTVGLLWGCDE